MKLCDCTMKLRDCTTELRKCIMKLCTRIITPALLVLAVAAVTAACNGTSTPVVGRIYDDAGCQIGCDQCAPLATCVSTPYQPACVLPCASSADCPTGQRCALLDIREDTPQPICLTPTTLKRCRTAPCNIQPRCLDAQTLLRPLAYQDQICGWELVPCDSGCDSTTAQCN
jgi:hypothetical protein